jgi:RNA polymerase sigma-70 factor (ECF subfamily)
MVARVITRRCAATTSDAYTLMYPAVSSIELTRCLRAVAASRDRAAFRVLFEYYAPRLSGYFFRRGVPLARTDDLVQETMLRIWVKAGYFDPSKGSPSAWVFIVARNLHLTMLRDGYLALPEDGGVMMVEDTAPRADVLLAEQEAEARLHQELEKLPVVQANLLRASFFEDKSHLEIAQERNLPIGTVKSHLRRAVIRLRQALPEGL